MSLKMNASVPSNEICVGQSLPVSVSLTNIGSDPVDVLSPLSDSSFIFELRPEDPNQPRRNYSQQSATFARDPDYHPEPIRNTISLKPGQSQTYVEDIAFYMVQPIPPGKFSLRVTRRDGMQAPPIPLTFVPLKPTLDSTTPSPSSGSFCHLVVHQTSNGSTLLFHKESMPGNPADGIWHNRFSAPVNNPITSAAAAIELASNNGYRWYAFLQKDHLSGAVADAEIGVSIPPRPLNLQSAALHPVGWQLTNELADFVALGMDGGKRLALAVITMKAPPDAAIAVIPVQPAAVPTAWTITSRTPGRAYDFIWSETSADTTRIYRQTVHADRKKADASVLLAERKAAVAAIAAAPIFPAQTAAFVDVLTGPEGEGRIMNLERLPLDGGNPLAAWSFPAPLDQNKTPPSAWVLAPAVLPDPVILARLADNLLAMRVNQPGAWTKLAGPSKGIDLVHADLVGTAVWASWTSDDGLHYRVVP